MLFYVNEKERYDDIPDSYKICVLSKSRILLNRENSIDFRMFIPDFVLTNKDVVNKRKYINQIKDNENYLVSLFYGNNVGDVEEGFMSNIVFVCEEEDIEEFDFLKIFRKFIRKKYGMKVFELTYDVTLSMMEEGEMSYEGKNRYLEKLMKLQETICKK